MYVLFHSRCPVCGSKKIIVDYVNGIIVCTNCGTVIDDFLVDTSMPKTRSIETRKDTKHTNYFSNLSLEISRRLKTINLSLNTIYKIINDFNTLNDKNNILLILGNRCVRRTLKNISNEKMKEALIEVLGYYIHNNELPYLAGYAEKYGINKEKLRRIVKRIIRKCYRNGNQYN